MPAPFRPFQAPPQAAKAPVQARPALPTLQRVAQPVRTPVRPAPPVFRPVAAPRPVPARVAPGPRTVQAYQVLPPAKIYQNAPAKRPYFGYPYAVVGAGMGAATFPAQEDQALGGIGNEFLAGVGGNAANVVNHPGGLSLRVSNDCEMAIENTDLQGRQPKAFYATAAVVAAANQRLATAGSGITLVTGAQTVTIWTGWYSQKILTIVTPQYNGGNPDQLPQNCNAVAARVTGVDPGTATGLTGKAAEVAARLAPRAQAAYKRAYAQDDVDLAPFEDRMAQEYVQSSGDWNNWWHSANKYAKPEVGETYVIATIGAGQRLATGQQRVRDYRSGLDRDLNWSFHFGGVVARSGKDRVTLENFARGDNRQDAADPRWYFQMYGEATGQTFHEANAARPDYANPLTVAVSANTRYLAPHRI